MFKNSITSTALTTAAANDFFEHIDGDSFQNDVSFVASLRALVAPRMKEDDELYFSYGYSDLSERQLAGLDTSRAIRLCTDIIRNSDYNRNRIVLHDFRHYNDAANRAWMELMKSSFEQSFPGWSRLEKVTMYYQKKFNVLCFINPELRTVQIFTEGLTLKNYHHLQAGIFAFLPWYFNPADGVSELERALVDSLTKTSSDQYEDCIAKIAEQYDFRTGRIKKMLAGFETRYERNLLREKKQTLESINRELDALRERVRDYLRRKTQIDLTIFGLEMKINGGSEESEMMDYFLSNRRLSLQEVTDEQMTFVATGYFTYFDEDAAERCIKNHTSVLYCPDGTDCDRYIPADDMELLMRAIFLDQKLKMRVCAAYTLYLEGGCRGINGYRYGPEFKTYTPNPHTDRYHCLGSYEDAINNFLRDRKYLEAVEQCVASCSSLNFCDPAVISVFVKRLYGIDGNVNIRCVELPDGSVVKPLEAIEYLKKEAEQNG